MDEDRKGARIPVVCYDEVEAAIAVEVADTNRGRVDSCWQNNLWLEGAVAVAEQDTSGKGIFVGDRQVKFAVGVEVAGLDGSGAGHGVVDVGQEGTVTLAKQDRDRAAEEIGDGQIGFAIVIKIGGGYPFGLSENSIVHGGPESAVTIAEQNRHVVRTGVGDSQVEFAVVVEVACGNGKRALAGGVKDGRLEGAITIAQKNGNIVSPVGVGGDGEVEIAVGIEVPEGEAVGGLSGLEMLGRLESAIAIAQ